MRGGGLLDLDLDLGSTGLRRPRRHWGRWLLAAGLLGCALPWLAAARLAAPGQLCGWLAPGPAAQLAALQSQNAALRQQLAAAALAQNEPPAPAEGAWHTARVVARWPGGATAACAGARVGAAVLDPQGRYTGVVAAVHPRADLVQIAFAGSANAPAAGFAGNAAGLLQTEGGWQLVNLPAEAQVAPGTVVTTPGGYWLGVAAAAPTPAPDGLSAALPLTDTADLTAPTYFIAAG